MQSPIQWFVDWIDERLERKHWQRNQARVQERVTEGNTLVDLYDTCPIECVVNASVRVEEVPPEPLPPHTPGPTTNVLRQYYAPRKGAPLPPPGTYVRIYRVLGAMGVLPHSGGRHGGK